MANSILRSPSIKCHGDDHGPMLQRSEIWESLQSEQDHEYLPLLVFVELMAIPLVNAASNSKEIPLLWKCYLLKIEVVHKILGYNQRLAIVIVMVHTIDKCIFTVAIKPILESLHLF